MSVKTEKFRSRQDLSLYSFTFYKTKLRGVFLAHSPSMARVTFVTLPKSRYKCSRKKASSPIIYVSCKLIVKKERFRS